MKHTLRTTALFFLTVTMAIPAYCQGLYWESLITRVGKSDTSMSKSYYMPKMFRQTGKTGDRGFIVRLDKKLLFIVNDADSEYSEITFDELERVMNKLGGKMSGAMAEMEKQMANMTPEQQKMMKEMMGDKIPGMKSKGKIEVSKTEEHRKISGYSCSKHVIKRGGEDFMALWTTTDIKGIASLGEEMEEFGKRMAAMNPMGDKAETEATLNVEGFPIQTEIAGVTTVVTKLEKKSFPAAEFDVPAGYKKVESDILKGLEEKE